MDKITGYLHREGMISLMSASKWRRLAVALENIVKDGPRVRVKYLLDDKPGPGFAHLDWEWLKEGDTIVIEWLEIELVQSTHQGALVPPVQSDISASVRSALKTAAVPFSQEGDVLRVWGHIKSGRQPQFL